ncbi:MAG: hypothetical protein IJR59_01040 [Firmicutes bacterium]|nr:hypothetical protein [Bacillota bacterium]
MKKTKFRDVIIALAVNLAVVLFVISLITDHLDKQRLIVERNAVKMVYNVCENYISDRYANGETVTNVTCRELAENGYISKNAETPEFEKFEIKISVIDGRPRVEYVKSKNFTYPEK